MAGPLPTQNPRRRNAPTIPTTNLPAGGRSDSAPEIPSWFDLGAVGRAWWDWAWTTPQAAAWTDSTGDTVARRASLVDDLAALEQVQGLDFTELLDADKQADVDRAIRRVAALATGKVQIMKQMLELDNRLGLNPRAMSDLRWKIVSDGSSSSDGDGDDSDNVVSIKRRVKATDAVAGS